MGRAEGGDTVLTGERPRTALEEMDEEEEDEVVPMVLRGVLSNDGVE